MFFIIEGANASGKSALIESLKKYFGNQFKFTYSVDLEFHKNINHSFKEKETKFFMYALANFNTLFNNKEKNIITDRSIFSSMAAFIATKEAYKGAFPIEKTKQEICDTVIKFFPTPSAIILLDVNEAVRRQRIGLKTGEERDADEKSLDYEDNKTKIREQLLTRYYPNIIHKIDTSYKDKNEVFENVKLLIETYMNNDEQ